MRELNPNLFESTPRPEGWTEPGNKALVKSDNPTLDRVIIEMRVQMKALEKMVVETKASNDDHQKLNHMRLEKMAQHAKALENVQTSSLKDIHERLATAITRLNERRTTDAKIEEMLDRHNQIIQGFEMKLRTLQKTLADRESQILKTMALLEDARAEIMRLKRL
jgi:chromosome segregation ATPase